jgi:hypothetical protein
MWLVGPWTMRAVPGLWPIVGGGVASWLAVRLWPSRSVFGVWRFVFRPERAAPGRRMAVGSAVTTERAA